MQLVSEAWIKPSRSGSRVSILNSTPDLMVGANNAEAGHTWALNREPLLLAAEDLFWHQFLHL